MTSALKEIHNNNPNAFDLSKATTSLFDYIATYDVLKITEPPDGAKTTKDVRTEQALPPTKSPRVMKALASLHS